MATLNGIAETLITIPKVFTRNRKSRILGFHENREANNEQCHYTTQQASRRTALTLAVAVSLSGGLGTTGISLAKDNGFWIEGPIPIPPIYNKEIANEETGTRSFLKNGIYMAKIGVKGYVRRIKKYSFDLIALEDLLGQNAWGYVVKYLRLKSSFLYYDFDKLISAASPSDKQPLIDLANRLFNSLEQESQLLPMRQLEDREGIWRRGVPISHALTLAANLTELRDSLAEDGSGEILTNISTFESPSRQGLRR